MFMRSLLSDSKGVVDIGIVVLVGVIFAALMVMAYIFWKIDEQLVPTGTTGLGDNHWTYFLQNSSGNITGGFDDAVSLILVAITVFILAIAIMALLMLRGR
jgi:hypothetical protein